jgi:hypothetical protein
MASSQSRRESIPRRKIREAVERHGLEVEDMEWQPIGGMIETQGREGGWTLFVKDCGVVIGYSWQDVVEQVDVCAPMWKNGSLHG